MLSAEAVGDGSLSYEWWNDFGPLYPPQTGNTLTLASVQPDESGSYKVHVRNAAGTVTSSRATLVVNSSLPETFLIARKGVGSGADPGGNVDIDSAGNLFAIGSFTGSASFGAFTLNSAGGTDVFLVKFNPAGNVAWARRVGGAGADAGAGVAVDRMGNVHLTGTFSRSVEFGVTTLAASGANEAFVTTFDRDGNLLWARKIGSTGHSKGWRIACDAAGNCVALGSFSGNATVGDATLSSSGGDDVFVVKFSARGDPLWLKRFGGAGIERGTGLALDPDANVFVTGSFQGTASFGSESLTSSGGTQSFLVKCDRAGSAQWAERISGIDSVAGTTVTAEDDGTCNLTGTFSGTATFGSTTLVNRESGERFVAKYNGTGSVQWVARSDAAGSQVSLQASDAAVTGPFGGGSLDWSGGAGGGVDLFVGKFSEPGVAAWAKQAGTSLAAFSLGLMMDANGQRYLTGFFEDEDGVNAGGGYSLARIAVAKAAGPPPPLFTQMPQGQSVFAGDAVSFSVTASATSPLSYQWRFNGSAIPGANGATLTVNNAQVSNAGNYSVLVLNAEGSVVSTAVELSVQAAPDTTAPVVSITSPATGARFTNATVVLQGTANDLVGLQRVEVQVGGGAVQVATGTGSWSATVTLAQGTNIVRVRSVDTSGNVSTWASRSLVFTPMATLVLTIRGNGSVTPNFIGLTLELGTTYSITATAAGGNSFSGWTGGLTDSGRTIRFVMEAGLSLQANFTVSTNELPSSGETNALVLMRASYAGLFRESGAPRQESCGFFSLVTTLGGRFTAMLTPGGQRVAISGRFNPSGSTTNQVVRSGTNVLSVVLELVSSDGVAELRGTVGGPDWMAEAWAGRTAAGSPTNPVSAAGRYTLIVPGTDNGSAPFGDGYGVAAVDARGRLRMAATLGDGTKLTQSTPLTEQGHWPFYGNLRSAGSVAMGWVTFVDRTTDDCGGNISWICRANLGKRMFSHGFAVESSMIGSRYSRPPGKNNRVVPIETGIVQFEGGNLIAPFDNTVFLTSNNRLVNQSSNHLGMTISLATGLFMGGATDPASGRRIPFSGALIQKQGAGWGQFRGTNQTGRVSIRQ